MPTDFRFFYPGITGVKSVEYTPSWGISPQLVSIIASPSSAPAPYGDLLFGEEGVGDVTLRDCQLIKTIDILDAGGRVVQILLEDRRWRWRLGPPMFGNYNQRDDHKKLIPKWVRSPTQLALLCLAAMGEASFDINVLPAGLAAASTPGVPTAAAGDTLVDAKQLYLTIGENLPPSGTNLPVFWEGIPAALALQQLVEQFGLQIAWDCVNDRVQVVRPGFGVPLPTGLPYESISPSTVAQGIPSSILIVGDHERYQARFKWVPVGKEWDGSWKPLSELSYAPFRLPQKMQVRVLSIPGSGIMLNGVVFTGTLAAVMALINASTDPAITGKVAASLDTSTGSTVLVVDGVNFGYEFELLAGDGTGLVNDVQAICTKGPVTPGVLPNNTYLVSPYTPTATGSFSIIVNGVTFTATGTVWEVAATTMTRLINTSPNAAIAGIAWATYGNGVMTIMAIPVGAGVVTVTAGTQTTVVTPYRSDRPGRGFEYSWAPTFSGIIPTARLNIQQARQLAFESVFRCYQLVVADVVPIPVPPPSPPPPPATLTGGDGSTIGTSTGSTIITATPSPPTAPTTTIDGVAYYAGLQIPGLGRRVFSPAEIILDNTMPQQEEPRAADINRVDLATGQAYAVGRYDGYSRDRENRAFGSVSMLVHSGGLWCRGLYFGATMPRSELYTKFRVVDAKRQVIQFDQPVFRLLGKHTTLTPAGAVVLPANIVTEMGCRIVDAITGDIVKYIRQFPVAIGRGPAVSFNYPEIQEEQIGVYDANHNLLATRVQDQDAEIRSLYYAQQRASTFQLSNALTARFGHTIRWSLDGLTRQVSWTFSEAGSYTTASANSEHSRVIIPAAERRRRENLPPDPTLAAQNFRTINADAANQNAKQVAQRTHGEYGGTR